MSYCRWATDSDVYVYEHVAGYFVCCLCSLEDRDDRDDAVMTTRSETIAHLAEHAAAGETVPPSATERLRAEIATIGEYSKEPGR